MNKSEVIALRQKALNQAKYHAKKWFNNGWGSQVLACVDVTFQDGSREISFKDTKNDFNHFGFIYAKNVFKTVSYDGIKLTVE